MKKKCTNPECEQPIKDVSEFQKDNRSKDGFQFRCNVCRSGAAKEYRKNNIGKVRQQKQRYRQSHAESIIERGKQYYIDNTEKILQRNKEYRDKNPEKRADMNRRWRQSNVDKCATYCAKRRSAKMNRTVQWANLDRIKKMYWVAKTLTERTCMKWVVDHIIPLQGKDVSGLHVENNLQVITHTRNTIKGNKFTLIQGIS